MRKRIEDRIHADGHIGQASPKVSASSIHQAAFLSEAWSNIALICRITVLWSP